MAPNPRSSCVRCGASLGPGASFCPRCGTGIPVQRPWSGPTLATPTGGIIDARPDAAEAQLAALRRATLGQYEILAELGRGGMATVYVAHDLALDRKVAIKVLAPALLLMGEGMVERFKREARTAAALSHPHIIPIYAVKESEHVLYFVMKYVQGRALDTVIRDVGTLPIPMVQTILAQVGDALGYAHRHGVIHRDIKSSNIMLDEDGWAVVTDFGIAKVMQAAGLTMTGVTVGTPTYMSPEQCETREVTGASDQYSLGVVAYEMLTGRLPFKGESTMAVMYAHFNERPRPVAELRPDCPPNLGAGVMRMLEKDPARRWPGMDDVVAVCGRPSLRHDDPVRGEMITLAKAGAGSALMAQIATPTSPLVLSKPQSHAPTVALPHARAGSRLLWGLGGLGGVAIDAGATSADLARGDTVFKGAESLAAQNRVPEAMVQLATAASLWADAERQSRGRAVRDSQQRRAAEPPAAPVLTPAPVDPRPDIQKVIDDYARPLESRDVNQVRHAYPGLTAAQQQAWQDFFQSTRNLKAGLTVSAVHLSGLTAEAIVSGVYEYDNASTGRGERRAVTFRAILVVDSAGWRLTAIR